MDKDQIDSLIWGDFQSEIVELQVPLWVASDYVKAMAMDGVLALFFGFLHFVQYKRGFKPNFHYEDGISFFEHDNVIPDFDDPSWWVKNLDQSDMCNYSFNYSMKDLPPNFYKQYFDKNENEHTICILVDTFSFFECGKILNETKLDDESKYSLTEILKEFHIKSDTYQRSYALSYFNPKYLVKNHTLVFRPSKLVEYLSTLNESFSSLEDFPEQVIRKEIWDKMGMVDQIGSYGKSELIFCKEDNIRKLLNDHSIKIPNVEFLTFYEYLKDKLDPRIKKEWEDIRNRYISNLKKSIIEPHLSNDYNKAKKFLREARKSFENKRYNESTLNSWNGIVKALNIFLKFPKIPDVEKIKLLNSHEKLTQYITKLDFIRINRNRLQAHPEKYENIDMKTAEWVLQVADDFLIDIQETI